MRTFLALAGLIAAALAVALALGVPQSLAVAALEQAPPVEGRLRLLTAKNGVVVLDDSYNAAPESMAAALNVLVQTSWKAARAGNFPEVARRRADEPRGHGPARRVAVLGDMRELGEFAGELHASVGRSVIDADVHLLITVGELAAEIAREAERYASDTNRPAPPHRHFADTAAAAAGIESLLAPLDCVLVKGSRAMEMETIVRALTGAREFNTHG